MANGRRGDGRYGDDHRWDMRRDMDQDRAERRWEGGEDVYGDRTGRGPGYRGGPGGRRRGPRRAGTGGWRALGRDDDRDRFYRAWDADRDRGTLGRERRFTEGPRGYTRPDDRIRDDLCDRLMGDWELDVSEVTVDVQDGVVRLGGVVDDRRTKHAIEDTAAAVLGVKEVDNRLRVEWRGGIEDKADREVTERGDGHARIESDRTWDGTTASA